MDNYQDLDCRQFNIKDTHHQKILSETFDEWIRESIDAVNLCRIYDIWDRNMLYYEGHQTPVGFSNNYLSEFVKANWERLNTTGILKKDEQGTIFVIDNQIPKLVDNIIGEYISQKQVFTVTKDDDIKNNKIERAIQQCFIQYEENKQAWQNVNVPAIEMMSKYGLAWRKDIYNPLRNVRHGGDIQSECIKPKDVLIDPTSDKKYFSDSRYRIHIKTLRRDEGIEYLSRFGIKKNEIRTESIDRLGHLDAYRYNQVINSSREQYINIYCIEYKKTYLDKYTKSSTYEQLGISENIDLLEERDYYFYAIYTQAISGSKYNSGVLYHSINKNSFSAQDYDKFYLTPFYNKKSDIRPYPKSDIEEVSNLQDMINIAETVRFDNLRQRQKFRFFIKQEIYNRYGDKIIDGAIQKGLLSNFITEGGAMPIDAEDMRDAVNIFQIPDMPREAYAFMDMLRQSFREQADTSSALQGDYPKYDMSGKAIQQLEIQKRKKLGYKDININWANTQAAKKIYNIFANEFTEEKFIKYTNAKKGDPKAIMLNAIRSYPEYEEMLIELGYVDEQTKVMLNMLAEDDSKYLEKKLTLLKSAMDKHAEENEVEFVNAKPSVMIDPYGQIVENDGITRYNKGTVFINMLSNKDEVSIKVSVDFDKERDDSETKLIATRLFESGNMELGMYCDVLGGWFEDNKQQIVEDKNKRDMAMMIANEIQKRGEEFKAAIFNLMKQFDQAKVVNNMPDTKQLNSKETIAG